MSWKQELLVASFRGVTFELAESERMDGRRQVVLEGPGRDEPYVQDLGAATRRVKVEGFVIGEDYARRRDALIAALRERGPGELTHPYYGTSLASVAAATISESTREGGMARFALEFVLEGDPAGVAASPTGAGETGEATDRVRDAAGESISRQIDRNPSNVVLSTSRVAVGTVSRGFERVVRERLSLLDLLNQPNPAAELIRTAERLGDVVLRRGNDWALWIQSTQVAYRTFGRGIRLRVDAFRALLEFSLDMLQAGSNREFRAVIAPSVASALAEAADQAAAVGSVWESRQAAVDARDDLLAALGALLEISDDTLGEAVRDLRAAVVGAIPDPSVDLPELATYTPPDTEPALVAAARLYGDPSRGDEIARRNRVRHPGFVPARAALEVLVDA